ncbi:hypothetical protein BDW69DRAFT_189948 [Aspergillus filifer]
MLVVGLRKTHNYIDISLKPTFFFAISTTLLSPRQISNTTSSPLQTILHQTTSKTCLLNLLIIALSATLASTHTVNCNTGRAGGDAKRIREGINYLRVNAHRARTLGPDECERPSCSYNSGNFWCNDSKKPRTMAMGHIADGAQTLYDECPNLKWRRGGITGELDHPDEWRVQNGWADC